MADKFVLQGPIDNMHWARWLERYLPATKYLWFMQTKTRRPVRLISSILILDAKRKLFCLMIQRKKRFSFEVIVFNRCPRPYRAIFSKQFEMNSDVFKQEYSNYIKLSYWVPQPSCPDTKYILFASLVNIQYHHSHFKWSSRINTILRFLSYLKQHLRNEYILNTS